MGITRRARTGARLEAKPVMQATCTLKHPNTEETESPVLQVDTHSMSKVATVITSLPSHSYTQHMGMWGVPFGCVL